MYFEKNEAKLKWIVVKTRKNTQKHGKNNKAKLNWNFEKKSHGKTNQSKMYFRKT